MTVLRPAPAFQGPLDSADLPAIATLGRTLIAHGFASDAVLAALGPPLAQTRSHVRDDVPLYLQRLSARTPLHTLITIFVLCQAVDEHAAADAFAPLSVDDVARLGVIERTDAGVGARVRLSGCSGLLLTHDAYDPRGTTNRDHVLDVNPTTNTLASLTVRRRVRSALDVGTGCGVVALMAARHSDRVVGVDTNPRALNYAVFNAALNGFDNVEFRQGSLFDPVHREKFDLIACNPPYVISPESRYIFRDGDRRGHGLCEEVVRRAPAHLESGGYATILCNWGVGPGQHWSAPLREWVDDSTCDTWLLCSGTQDPVTYAAIWNRGPDAAAYREALETWPAYHRELGFEKIGIGAVILRRRSTAGGWVRTDVLPDGPFEPDETLIPRIFDAQDRLAALPSDDALLACACLPTNAHELHQVLTLRDGRYIVRDAEIRLDAGLKFRGAVDPYTTHLLTRCNGQVTLEDIADEIASRAPNDREEVRRATATIARRLISLGFLIPIN